MTERKGNTYSVSNDVNLLYGVAVEVTGDGYNASPEENFVNSCKHQYQTRLCIPLQKSDFKGYAHLWSIFVWGCGKTMLMDMFYDEVPVDRKQRVHFHSFMLDVHSSTLFRYTQDCK